MNLAWQRQESSSCSGSEGLYAISSFSQETWAPGLPLSETKCTTETQNHVRKPASEIVGQATIESLSSQMRNKLQVKPE